MEQVVAWSLTCPHMSGRFPSVEWVISGDSVRRCGRLLSLTLGLLNARRGVVLDHAACGAVLAALHDLELTVVDGAGSIEAS